ncbi:MAG TPA: hypothetical protein VH700_08885 [Gemmatimonadales bacterium]|jgi:hypothetical protein
MSDMNRREFAEAIALVSLAPLLGERVGWSSLAAVESGAALDDPGSLAKALAGVIRAQYGTRLSEADFGVITRQIQSSLERAAKVRKVPLTNGDEPDFVFSPIRVPGVG